MKQIEAKPAKQAGKRLPPNGKRRYNQALLKDNIALSLIALPGVLLVFIFCYLPLPGIAIAFKNFNPNLGIWGSEWSGFKNFEFFFTSQDAARTISNTLFYSVLFLVVDLVAAVTLALMLYNLKSKGALKFYNTVVILPKFMSMVIVAFIVYLILNPTSGILNQIIVAFGGEKIQWYSESKYWPYILTITHVWKTVGMNCVLYYATLMGVDDTLLEAARLDGATKWQETWHVVIPHLIPVMVIATILAIGDLFTGDFGLFYQVPKNVGLLYPTTDIINTYTFRAMMSGSMAKSAAVGLFQNGVGLVLVVGVNAIVRKISPEHSLF